MNSIYRCEEPYFGELANLESLTQQYTEEEIEEGLKQLKDDCESIKNKTDIQEFEEQDFQYIEAEECKCCPITEESFAHDEEESVESAQSVITAGSVEEGTTEGNAEATLQQSNLIEQEQEQVESENVDIAGGAIKGAILSGDSSRGVLFPVFLVVLTVGVMFLVVSFLKKK